jgi:hypothetical protein
VELCRVGVSIPEAVFRNRTAGFLAGRGKSTQAVANTAWACTTLGFQSPTLFTEIKRRASWLVEEGKPQAVNFDPVEVFPDNDDHAEDVEEDARTKLLMTLKKDKIKKGEIGVAPISRMN